MKLALIAMYAGSVMLIMQGAITGNEQPMAGGIIWLVITGIVNGVFALGKRAAK